MVVMSQRCGNGAQQPILPPGDERSAAEELFRPRTHGERTVPTTCIETIGGDPATAMRLSFQIKVF